VRLHVEVRQPLGRITLDATLSTSARFTAVVGPSGSGKTSLLNVIAGLTTPERGVVRIDDDVLTDTQAKIQIPPHRRRIGYVFQEPRLFPHLNVRHNLVFGFALGARRNGQRVSLDDVVGMLDLDALLARRTTGLSGGERQRVALGRALLSNPRLLLLDEPLASVDVATRAEVLPYLDRLREHLDLPTIYVTHTWSEVESRAEHVVRMNEGRSEAGTTPTTRPTQAGQDL
jgi:molybdate transport system ATP-binding protein